MIDLNKKTEIDVTEEISLSSPSKKDISREANAKKFLYMMLGLVVLLVSVVCIVVAKRNETLLAQQKIDEATKSTTAQAQIAPAVNGSDATALPQDATDATSQATGASTEPGTTVISAGVTVAQGGAIDNPTIITIDEANWHLTLVNSGYRISDSYKPDLVYVCGSEERLDKKVAVQYEKMYNAALQDGVTLTPCSGYRSYETQERNYNRKVEFFEGQGFSTEEAKVKAATIIMPPGSSEHNLGYAMDIVCVDEWFEDTEEFKWLQKNAQDYGFIMRYPEDKQDITKVIYEPWHWRYVGVETAKALKSSGLVLEEYLGVAQ